MSVLKLLSFNLYDFKFGKKTNINNTKNLSIICYQSPRCKILGV